MKRCELERVYVEKRCERVGIYERVKGVYVVKKRFVFILSALSAMLSMLSMLTMLAILPMLISGCATPDGTDSSGKPFRDNWWNYYERGVSRQESGQLNESVSDITSAIEKREADQWRARTYGMHFVDYFPHRELGITYFKMKRYNDALRELEASLNQAESAKAKFYLNKTRKAILEEQGTGALPPTLTINIPNNISNNISNENYFTNEFSVKVSGIAEGENYISSVNVNGKPLLLELSAKRFSFESEVPLSREGLNDIKIVAVDLAGRQVEKIVRINVDRQGPGISVDEMLRTGNKLRVSGSVSDSSGIISVEIGGKPFYTLSPGAAPLTDLPFNVETMISEGKGTVVMKAKDIAGNVTETELTGTELSGNSDPVFMADNVNGGSVMFDNINVGNINAGNIASGSVNAASILLAEGSLSDADVLLPRFMPRISPYFFASSFPERALVIGLKDKVSSTPPNIKLKGIGSEQTLQTLYEDKIVIEGIVSDDSKVSSIKVNKEEVLKKPGKMVSFSYIANLSPGVNTFTVEAIDGSGNKDTRTFKVNRKVQEIKSIVSRLSLALLPLELKGDKSPASDVIYDQVVESFVQDGRFNIVDRQRLSEVLKELKLSQSDLADPSTAIKAGKLAAAEAILIGSCVETKDSIEIIMRLIDTETSEILSSNDAYGERKSLNDVKALSEVITVKFRNDFPLVEGIVIKESGNGIITDLGLDQKLKKGRKLIIFRAGQVIKHPQTGRILGADTITLGEARVESVQKEFSNAVVTKKPKEQLKTTDMVITK
ncbi:MAG: hypothetical protein HQK89_10740 [Nitrospirae bacterium]|nr:hypothetical protein [Nitrospirota bacterium]